MAKKMVAQGSALSSDEQTVLWLWRRMDGSDKRDLLRELKQRWVLLMLDREFGPVKAAKPRLRLIQGGRPA